MHKGSKLHPNSRYQETSTSLTVAARLLCSLLLLTCGDRIQGPQAQDACTTGLQAEDEAFMILCKEQSFKHARPMSNWQELG
jgi:hypothetical protein